MTVPTEEPLDPIPTDLSRSSFRFTWALAAAGIVVLLLACMGLILIASFRG